MKLWIDDERLPTEEYDTIALTSATAIHWLRLHQSVTDGPLELISFDHDLGGDDTTRGVLIWMIENNVWPKEIRVHTANPVGRDWLVGTAAQYAPEWVHISPSNPYEGWM